MLPTEQARFFGIVADALGAYAKYPSPQDLEAWWRECQKFTLDALEVGLKSHKEDPDRGERAPRPADITRRLKTGSREGSRCADVDPTGRCEYQGVFSDGTLGEGSWYCPWHRLERSGPEASRFIEASRNYAEEGAFAKRLARYHAESIRAPSVVNTAWDIAKRHGNRPWQTGIADKLPEFLKRERAA
jgi:hypothetical protein